VRPAASESLGKKFEKWFSVELGPF